MHQTVNVLADTNIPLVNVKCTCCGKTFGYFGPELEVYYCSTFCSDKHGVKGPPTWKRQGTAIYQKAKTKRTLEEGILAHSQQKKVEEEPIITTVERGDRPKVLIRKGPMNKKGLETPKQEMKEENLKSEQTQNLEKNKESGAMMPTIEIKTSEMQNELKEKEEMQNMKIEDTETGTQEIEMTNLIKLPKEEDNTDQTSLSMISSKELILEVSESTKQLNESARFVMERLELTKVDRTPKGTEATIKCARAIKELIKTKLELSKFARTVNKDERGEA